MQLDGCTAVRVVSGRNAVYRGSCLCEENRRGGTEASLEITCDVEENTMSEKALVMWPWWKED